MRLYLVKSGDTLVGWGPDDKAYLDKLGDGESLECDTRKARHPKHHRLFFALLQESFKHQERYSNIADLLVELKIRCGWYDEHITQRGEVVYVPRSISWARMDQDTFEEFFNQAVRVLADMFGAPNVVAEADEIIAKAG